MSTSMELLEFEYANPVKCIYHRPVGEKYVVPHWHEAIEITFVEKGNPGKMYLEGQEYSLSQDDVYVTNSRLIHSFDTVITPDQRIITLLINYDWFRNCLPKTIRNKKIELIKAPKKDSQRAAFAKLIELIKQVKDIQVQNVDEYEHLHQLSLTLELVSILIKNFVVDKKVEQKIPEVISMAIEDFHNQYSSDLRLTDMAKKYNYSYAYFSKLFKRYLGMSPKKYLTLLRIQNAAELIEKTDDKLTTIVVKTGFPDEKSFYAAFKGKYGKTPSEYRKQLQVTTE